LLYDITSDLMLGLGLRLVFSLSVNRLVAASEEISGAGKIQKETTPTPFYTHAYYTRQLWSP